MSDLHELGVRVERAADAAQERLLAERSAGGWWEGELSSSALSTAVAVLALGEFARSQSEKRSAVKVRETEHNSSAGEGRRVDDGVILDMIHAGLRWLAETQLADGGWGDTEKSRANVATTLLVWAAFGLGSRMPGIQAELGPPRQSEGRARPPLDGDAVVAGAERWILREAGGLEAAKLKGALAKRYGKDKTFAVPILMACAVGGRLGAAPECWRDVPALPFELAAFPRKWFAALRLPVVSYALPALIAIGQVRYVHAPVRGPWGWARRAALGRTLRLLREIQPEGGGFLEATPLTGFVTMALCSAGEAKGAVVREAVGFLCRSVREDGSWPIDTNLATWATSLSVKALERDFPAEAWAGVRTWLLRQQYREQHAYCLSPPGGWAWTDLSGGVPDADDTAGALLALRELSGPAGDDAEAANPRQTDKAMLETVTAAANSGVRWLAGLQNTNGGMPTFCKGWGALPFDRSAPDLTAHALAAWHAWRGEVAVDLKPAMRRAVVWLAKTQRTDGAWVPLWFGNENEADEGNPVYGTAVVLKYISRLSAKEFPPFHKVRLKAAVFLTGVQQADGSWSGGSGGGPGSIEETGAALEALVAYAGTIDGGGPEMLTVYNLAITRGAAALLRLSAGGTEFPPAPIGLYFARLWYYEKLYPRIAAVAALRAIRRYLAGLTN